MEFRNGFPGNPRAKNAESPVVGMNCREDEAKCSQTGPFLAFLARRLGKMATERPKHQRWSYGLETNPWVEFYGNDLSRLLPLYPRSCIMSQFGSAFQIKLSLNLFAVIFDGLDAQVKFRSNFAGLFPLANQLENFHFTIA